MRTVSVREAMEIALQHHQAGRWRQAQAIYRQVLDRSPKNADALHLLGVLAHQEGRDEESVALIQEAIGVNPKEAAFHINLGQTYRALGLADRAAASYERAIALNPQSPEIYYSMGKALRDMGRYEEAVASYAKAIQLKPDHAGAHFDRAVILFLKGEFEEGCKEYEWRWRAEEFLGARPAFPQPEWKGEDLAGRTILLYGEQGFGDTIQFVRYAPLLARRGARVIVSCRPELVSLLSDVEGVDEVLPRDGPPFDKLKAPSSVEGLKAPSEVEGLPPFDTYAPMLSLPLAFGTTLQTIPGQTPYVKADPALVETWRARLTSAGGLRVGLAWAGSPTHKNDRNRSIPLSSFAPVAGVRGVTFYSLQKGEAAAQARTPPPGIALVDLTKEIKNFADTAALIANLDLVISVDTAAAHLAGAMGRPVWTLLPFLPDWRWMLDREDSPWYPTMRLFRQRTRGEWAEVVERVAGELRMRVQGSGNG